MEEQDLRLKFKQQAELFDFHFTRKEFWEAVLIEQQVKSAALFLEADESFMKELFGDGGYRKNGETEIYGMFHAKRIEKAVLESCIKGNHSIQKLTYQEVMDMWQKKRS